MTHEQLEQVAHDIFQSMVDAKMSPTDLCSIISIMAAFAVFAGALDERSDAAIDEIALRARQKHADLQKAYLAPRVQ